MPEVRFPRKLALGIPLNRAGLASKSRLEPEVALLNQISLPSIRLKNRSELKVSLPILTVHPRARLQDLKHVYLFHAIMVLLGDGLR